MAWDVWEYDTEGCRLRATQTHSFIEPSAYPRFRRNSMVQGYCVKCRAKREIKDAVEVKLKNGKPAMKGKCPVCGTTMMRIGAGK